MGSLDEPDVYTFKRIGEIAPSEVTAAWQDVRIGRARQAHDDASGMTRANDNLKRYKEGKAGLGKGLTPGFSRGGKPVDA